MLTFERYLELSPDLANQSPEVIELARRVWEIAYHNGWEDCRLEFEPNP
jgi:hypothetical protein